jgi:drug/metabolite transporter (DMT)-like permease
MSSVNLLRWGGRSAILGGILRGINSFLPIETPTSILELMYFLTDICILFGLMAIYGFQHEESGRWGFAGFVFSIIGTGIIIGADGYISGVNMYPVGSLILAVGLVLLSIGSWIADRLPHWIPICWTSSTLLGILGYFIPSFSLLFVISGVLFGLAFAGAGKQILVSTPSPKSSSSLKL